MRPNIAINPKDTTKHKKWYLWFISMSSIRKWSTVKISKAISVLSDLLKKIWEWRIDGSKLPVDTG